MLDIKISVSILLVSVLVYNSMAAENNCISNGRFDESQLPGMWYFVTEVSAKPQRIRCGRLFLERESEGKFSGYRFGYYGEKAKNETISVALTDNIFELSLLKDKVIKVPLVIATCDGRTEFALEHKLRNTYLIFSKNKAASKQFMNKYKSLAQSKGLKIRNRFKSDCEH